MTNERIEQKTDKNIPADGVRLPKGVIDGSLFDTEEHEGVYDDHVISSFEGIELSPIQSALVRTRSFFDGSSGYYKILDRLKVVRDEHDRQKGFSEALKPYENASGQLTQEAIREIFHTIYTPATKREQVKPADKEEIFSIKIPSFSIDPIGSVRAVIDEKIGSATTAQNYLEIMKARKELERGWVFGVWTNSQLSASDKVGKLEDYSNWVLENRDFPPEATEAIEGLVFKHRLLGAGDRVNPVYQTGLVVEAVIEEAVERSLESGEVLTISQKFKDFITKLSIEAAKEDQDPESIHPRNNILRKSATAGAYLSAIGNYLYGEGSDPRFNELTNSPKERAQAMVEIADALEDAERIRLEISGQKSKNRFATDDWLYSKTVSDHVDNPYLAEIFLSRLDDDPALVSRKIQRAQHGRLHDDFVGLAVSIIENVSTQEGRNVLAPKVGLLLRRMNENNSAGKNRKNIIVIANQLKRNNKDSQLISGEKIGDTYDALAYILECTRDGADTEAERYDSVYLALAEKVLGFSTRKHSEAYVKAVQNALSEGRGAFGWYKSLKGGPAPKMRIGPKTPGQQVRTSPPKGILN